jgi:NADPH-dependent 7-cyano-7-deazaguanine reductase QueF-like protein
LTGVLGERVDAPTRYSPEILEAIPRQPARERLGIVGQHGHGWDAWHLYELSWLEAGKPISACGVLGIPSTSPATVESKSLKLYLNSLNSPSRRGGRVVEGARLESVYTATYRGFESLPLRHLDRPPHTLGYGPLS